MNDIFDKLKLLRSQSAQRLIITINSGVKQLNQIMHDFQVLVMFQLSRLLYKRQAKCLEKYLCFIFYSKLLASNSL